jgi:hypothetical protein
MRTQDVVEKSEAEIAAASDRRKEQGRRLQDMQSKPSLMILSWRSR